jgi:hypothetical protein
LRQSGFLNLELRFLRWANTKERARSCLQPAINMYQLCGGGEPPPELVRFASVGAVDSHSRSAAPSLVSVTSELRKGDPNIRSGHSAYGRFSVSPWSLGGQRLLADASSTSTT